jgi:selenocysteine lyase/cysteine desulfurase
VHANTLIEGGSGYQSLESKMPESLPERHEAGTLPAPIIAGLAVGIREVRERGVEAIRAHEGKLTARLCEMLAELDHVRVYVPQYRGSVVLFSADSLPSDQIGRELDRRGICVRTGFHCAALAHKTLGTPDTGAVRVSVGMNTRQNDLDALYSSLREIFQ